MYQSKIGLYYDYATFLKLRDLNKYFYNIEKQNEINERYQYLNDHQSHQSFYRFIIYLATKKYPRFKLIDDISVIELNMEL